MLDKSVEFGFLVLIVLLSDKSNSDSSWDVSDSVGPDESVQGSVNSDVLYKYF